MSSTNRASSPCPVAEFHDQYFGFSVDKANGPDGPPNSLLESLSEDSTALRTDVASSSVPVGAFRQTRSESRRFSFPSCRRFDFDWQFVGTIRPPEWPEDKDSTFTGMSPKGLAASVRDHGSSDAHTNTWLSIVPTAASSTSPQRRKIKTPLPPKRLSSKGWEPETSNWAPKTPEKDARESTPGSKPVPDTILKANEEPTGYGSASVANIPQDLPSNTMANSAASTGCEGNIHDVHLSNEGLDYNCKGGADVHRLEATAMLACLLCSTFFKDANTLRERIDLLTVLCTGIQNDDEYIKTVAKFVGAKSPSAEPSTKAEKTKSELDEAASADLTDQEQVSVLPEEYPSDGDSIPETPDRHDLKRKGSTLTGPFLTGLLQPSSPETLALGPSRLSLSILPNFEFGAFPQPESSSPSEPRSIKLCIRRITSSNDLRFADFTEPTLADENCYITIAEEDLALSSVEAEDQPSFSSGIARPDHETVMPSRNDLLSIRDRHAELSSPGFRSWSPDSKGILHYEDQPTIRRFVPYTTALASSMTPQMILRRALLNPLTEKEMGTAMQYSSNGGSRRMKTHEGLIYIYRLLGEFNMVKIGITQVTVKDRLAGWTGKCGHETYLAYPLTKSEERPVPNIYRLEALVHAELAINRKREQHCSCGEKHKEWFEEDLAHARKVVIKWSEWMRKRPYQDIQPQGWHLTLPHRNNLANLSLPSPRDVREGPEPSPRPRSSLTPMKVRKIASRPAKLRSVTAPP